MRPALIKALVVATALIMLNGCGTTPHGPVAASELPDHFRVSFDRWLGGTLAVEQRGAQLLYTVDYDSSVAHRYTHHVTPSQTAWISFWHEVDSIDLWRWRPRYEEPPSVATTDGTQWQIDIRHKNLRLRSSADNAYPSDSDPQKTGSEAGDPSQRFRRFEAAVRRLVGDRDLEKIRG